MPGPGKGKPQGGVFNQGGELFMVNKSAPTKQAAAWKFLKFLAEPENVTPWAIATGYIPIRKSSASSTEMQDYWAQNPGFKVAYDQLLGGRDTVATVGSVIGDNKGVRDALRDAMNSMFLEGTSPKSAVEPPPRSSRPPRSRTTTAGSAADTARPLRIGHAVPAATTYEGCQHAVVEALGGIRSRRSGGRSRLDDRGGGAGRERGHEHHVPLGVR